MKFKFVEKLSTEDTAIINSAINAYNKRNKDVKIKLDSNFNKLLLETNLKISDLNEHIQKLIAEFAKKNIIVDLPTSIEHQTELGVRVKSNIPKQQVIDIK